MNKDEQITEDDLEALWNYFHEIVDNRRDAEYQNLQSK